ncbi:VOC family protein [Lysinibacter cavernae]|uniref:PhnB protein n=1 Tax=Lysinibacter cavernae TaxID=1640652 RepID=A0A7X5QYF9_9MICO|nr:VOC family protein [Lysinibacter cavernae]NIH52290.1 PhnB protein [Lysinibacter cavernae]
MSTRINTYLSFRDSARQAVAFYQTVFGGEYTLSTFGEFQASEDPAENDKVMHSMLTTSTDQVIMCADTPNSMELTQGTNYSMSISGEDEAELTGYWQKLTADGTITMPLNKAPWGDSFGMCVDKFGVSWMVNIAGVPGS